MERRGRDRAGEDGTGQHRTGQDSKASFVPWSPCLIFDLTAPGSEKCFKVLPGSPGDAPAAHPGVSIWPVCSPSSGPRLTQTIPRSPRGAGVARCRPVAPQRAQRRRAAPSRETRSEADRGVIGRPGRPTGRPRRPAIRIRPADVRAGCRAPPGGRFYIAPPLRSAGDRDKGSDLAAVSDAAFQEPGVTSEIVPAEPGWPHVTRSPEIGPAGV